MPLRDDAPERSKTTKAEEHAQAVMSITAHRYAVDASATALAIRLDGPIWIVGPDTYSRHWFARDAWRDIYLPFRVTFAWRKTDL
jgi:hypothetical protein